MKAALRFGSAQNVAVAAFEGGTGYDGVVRTVLRLLRHPVAQIAQPRIAVFIGQRNTRAHLVAVGLGVELVAFGIGTLTEVFLQGQRGGGLAAAAYAHNDKMRSHLLSFPSVRRWRTAVRTRQSR